MRWELKENFSSLLNALQLHDSRVGLMIMNAFGLLVMTVAMIFFVPEYKRMATERQKEIVSSNDDHMPAS